MNEKEITKLLCDPDYLIKKYFYNQKFCMAYDKNLCDETIIRSHIISKRYMKNIAKNGQVYTAVGSSHHNNGLYEFFLKGLDKVAHINGFCQHHDNILFESFEKKDFVGKYEQIYAISFRALCREYFQKKCVLSVSENLKNGRLSEIDSVGYCKSPDFSKHIDCLKFSVRDLKFIYEQLKKYKNSGLKYILIATEKLPISATGVLFPLHDASGRKIQNSSRKQHGFIYNMISLEDKSYILIATVTKVGSNIHKYFLDAICQLKNVDKIDYLLTYFFFTNDNIVIDPDWYESLSSDFKAELVSLMNKQMGDYDEVHNIHKLLNFSKKTNVSIIKTLICI